MFSRKLPTDTDTVVTVIKLLRRFIIKKEKFLRSGNEETKSFLEKRIVFNLCRQ